jgi:TrmH family RNA methyltransferase
LLRSALALGWDGVFFTPETVDPFNDKALRASKGALFSLPFAYGDGASFVREEKRQIYLADLEGTSLKGMSPKSPFVLILSHEGTGPSAWAEKCAQKISIPMHNSVESLNVSACGAIFLYVMGPHD